MDKSNRLYTNNRLTYPKGVHSFRYFPYINTIVVCSCICAFCLVIAIRHSMRTLNMYTLSGNCNSQAKCIYAWADNKRIWQNEYMHEQIWCTHWVEEVPEWVYAFWVCKPVKQPLMSEEVSVKGVGVSFLKLLSWIRCHCYVLGGRPLIIWDGANF